jgi:hypothetical protein
MTIDGVFDAGDSFVAQVARRGRPGVLAEHSSTSLGRNT